MNRLLKYVFVFFFFSLFSGPSLVFIHLGRELPSYLPIAISQARLFNPNCPIYLIANESALQTLPFELIQSHPICVAAETLPKEAFHEQFQRRTKLNRSSREGFWVFTTERFFYLYELMKKYDLSDVFHLEYDNMLYTDVETILGALQTHYSGKMAATFDNDQRCIAGLIYISQRAPLKKFLRFVLSKVQSSYNDMEFLAQFKHFEGGSYIDHLPIVMPSYGKEHRLESAYHHVASSAELYSNHFDVFQSVFDAAALGQYLGGEDPRNGSKGPGFINESCVFNPSFFQFEWIADVQGRLVPFVIYKNERWPINNLHIHCKDLKLFYSRRT